MINLNLQQRLQVKAANQRLQTNQSLRISQQTLKTSAPIQQERIRTIQRNQNQNLQLRLQVSTMPDQIPQQ